MQQKTLALFVTQPTSRFRHGQCSAAVRRDGVYVGESSRSLHERAVEHVRDARTFSAKSHIVKHWMTSHPSLPSPPAMEFSVTGRFKDCLSRQISEALMINNSTDVLLNSKGEYGHNSVTRLVVQEDVWTRRERDRLEEEQADLNKKQVEQFKHQKLFQVIDIKDSKEVHLSGVAGDSSNVSCTPPEERGGAGMDENPHVKTLMNDHEILVESIDQPVPEGWKADPSSGNPSGGMEGRFVTNDLEDGQVGSVTAQTGTKCNNVESDSQTIPNKSASEASQEISSRRMETVTEKDPEVGQVGSVNTHTGTECNIVMSESLPFPSQEIATRWMDEIIFKKDPDVGQVGSVTTHTGTVCNIVKPEIILYDTDEEEFSRPGDTDVIPAVCTFSAVYTKHKTEKKNTAKRNMTKNLMNNLSYFNLWWRRMEVEARKDAKMYRKKEEDEMLDMRKKMNIFRKAEYATNVTDVLSYQTTVVPHKSAQSRNITFVMGERGVTFNVKGDTNDEPFMDDTKLPAATTGGWSGGK